MKKLILLFILSFSISNMYAQYADSINFEQPNAKIVILPTSNNLWQIGTPHKTFFNSAHHGNRAIVTDTMSNYPPNDTSSFLYIIHHGLVQTCRTCMSFSHKYDMDTIGDKGIIEASYDGGNSWLIVKDTNGDFGMGWSYFQWNSDIIESSSNYQMHKLITNGKSNGWIRSEFCWHWFLPVKNDTIIVMPDSLMLRFTFISDSVIKNKEGWMIDDIGTWAAGAGECSGIEENASQQHAKVSPNPFSTSTQISFDKTYPNIALSLYDLQGKLLLQNHYTDCNQITLHRNQLSNGLYFLKLIIDDKQIETRKIVISD